MKQNFLGLFVVALLVVVIVYHGLNGSDSRTSVDAPITKKKAKKQPGTQKAEPEILKKAPDSQNAAHDEHYGSNVDAWRTVLGDTIAQKMTEAGDDVKIAIGEKVLQQIQSMDPAFLKTLLGEKRSQWLVSKDAMAPSNMGDSFRKAIGERVLEKIASGEEPPPAEHLGKELEIIVERLGGSGDGTLADGKMKR